MDNYLVEEPESFYRNNSSYPLQSETYKIIGACMEVHKELGNGFLEAVYKDALEVELSGQNIPFVSEKEYPVYYKGVKLKRKYIADFIVFDEVVLEIKAIESLAIAHTAQVINYLKTSDNKIGLLVNFGEDSLKFKRLIK